MESNSPISTHVFDLTTGLPAVGMFVVLEHYQDSDRDWQTIAEAKTDEEGRTDELLPPGNVEEGLYRLTFDTDAYFGDSSVRTFYSSISINFQASSTEGQYHVPLLLSPYGYSTFRQR